MTRPRAGRWLTCRWARRVITNGRSRRARPSCGSGRRFLGQGPCRTPITGRARREQPDVGHLDPEPTEGSTAMKKPAPAMTHAAGSPVVGNLNAMAAGRRGPTLLQDIWLLEKFAHFDREAIPEWRMHAKGWGAYGRRPRRLLGAQRPRRTTRCRRSLFQSNLNQAQPTSEMRLRLELQRRAR